MRLDPSRPLADGIRFDDTEGMTLEQVNLLAARGVVWMTSFGDRCGRIVAASLEQAERVAFGRGLGETVDGQLVEAGRIDL